MTKPILRWPGRTLLVLLLTLVLLYTLRLAQRPARTDQHQTLLDGMTYERRALSEPRPLLVHIVEIDLAAPGVGLLVTPPENDIPARQRGGFATLPRRARAVQALQQGERVEGNPLRGDHVVVAQRGVEGAIGGEGEEEACNDGGHKRKIED